MNKNIYSFLGLAKKAGKLVSGGDTCARALKSGKAFLVIVAEDASENTKKEFKDSCSYRGVNICYFGKKELLGKYTGKDIRSVIAILDKGFSDELKARIENCSKEDGGGLNGKN
jgi:ribosomal protein L7Ae-like RNA K-turn-binding protein